MISIDGLAVEFGGTTLFSDISFVINEKDRIALMGKNGAGKSTLLKILAGVRQPTRGKISAPKDSVIAYLPQHLMTEDGRTVFQEAAQAFAHLHEMEAEIERLNKELETRTDYESDSYMELIENVSALSEKFYAIDSTNDEEDVEKALLGLGFVREDFNRQTSDFSGGWRMRIELAKLLLQKPDVLLLDEPTNHLDITSKEILESALNRYTGTVLYVSHDRYFINRTATRILDLTDGSFINYIGNYDYYLEKKEDVEAAFAARQMAEAGNNRTAGANGTQAQSVSAVSGVSSASSQAPMTASAAGSLADGKMDWKAQKEEQSRLRKRQNELKKVEDKIHELETRDGEIDELLSQEDVYTDVSRLMELNKEKESIQKELEVLYEKWEELAE